MPNKSTLSVCKECNTKGRIAKKTKRFYKQNLFLGFFLAALFSFSFCETAIFAQNRQNTSLKSNQTTNQHVQSSISQNQRTPRASASERVSAGFSYEDEMRDCMKRIPWEDLSTESRRKIQSVARQHSLFRRMPTQAVYCDPEVYQYLLEHPDLVVGFWERLGATEISVKEIKEDNYLMRETTGTVATVEVLHRTKNHCIVYAKGQYRAPFLARGIDGETVLFLRNRFGRDKDNEPFVVCALDAFIKIDNAGADFLAKLFATSLGKIADSNFEQTAAFVGHVSDASAVNAESVKAVSRQVRGVRKEVREDFVDVIDRVCMRTANREGRMLPQYTYSMKASRNEPPGPGINVFSKAESLEDQANLSVEIPEKIFRGYDTMFPDDCKEKTEADIAEKVGRNVALEMMDDSVGAVPKMQSSYAVPSLPVGGTITFSVIPADQTQNLHSVYEMPLPPNSSHSFKPASSGTTENSNIVESDQTSVSLDLATEVTEPPKPKGRVVFGTPRIVREELPIQ